MVNDLWCGFCGTQDFTEHTAAESGHTRWECNKCGAGYELNHGYGYFTVESFRGDAHYGDRDNAGDGFGIYSLGTGELMDDTKLPRTPEGIMRATYSEEGIGAYLKRTQIK